MLHGSDLAGTAATVEMARLEDADAAGASKPADKAVDTKAWTRVPVLQGDEQTLKFVVPANWRPGVYACRISAGGGASDVLLLNAPDPWWVQGDEGDAASPGGWLRVMGKSLVLAGPAVARLEPEKGDPVVLKPAGADGYCLRFDVPADLPSGRYTVRVHNGSGGPAAWREAGKIDVRPAPVFPPAVYSVLETYGPDAVKQMRTTLVKYNQPLDRTDGIQAALKKAKDNGGGVVFFPAGRYTVKGPLVVPPRTVLRGEGEGLVTLWWGAGHFNLDGGDARGREKVDGPKPPPVLMYGKDYAIEDLSLYLPVDYEQGIVADDRLRMTHVRVRIDHYWLVQGRGNGTVARLGRNAQVIDCDILGKGDTLVPGRYNLIARNKISSNKSNTPMGSSRELIVEDNQFVSMDPTAYQNISGLGRNIYYARNKHEALYAHQSDFSFTFDAGTGSYLGGVTRRRKQADARGRTRLPQVGGRAERRLAAVGGLHPRRPWCRAVARHSFKQGPGVGDRPAVRRRAGRDQRRVDRELQRPGAGRRQPLRRRQLGERRLRHVGRRRLRRQPAAAVRRPDEPRRPRQARRPRHRAFLARPILR